MLADFADIHRTYLIPKYQDGKWVFTPTNPDKPRVGFFPSTHQVFSNHALQVAIFLYNAVSDEGACTGVSHCLYLNFTRKAQGSYLLNNDEQRLTFNLDLGVAGELYGLMQGQADTFSYSAIRPGRSPKHLHGSVHVKNGRRLVILNAESVKEGASSSITVELDRAAQIAIAAHAVGYGKLLYPALSDVAIQSLLSEPLGNFRACADQTEQALLKPEASLARSGDDRACAEERPIYEADSRTHARLGKVVWAIGNQKWPSMTKDALRRIQSIVDLTLLQAMIDEANAGDFRKWDSYL